MSLPVVAMPVHDPDGLILHHLDQISPILRQNFHKVYLSVTPATSETFQSQVDKLARDDLYHLVFPAYGAEIGVQLKLLYQEAVEFSHPDQILHLCYPDRLVFALQDKFRNQFINDIRTLQSENVPIIFERSQSAWNTHPSNYYEIENIITMVSKRLLGRAIDFAWCHLALQSSNLSQILPGVNRTDLSFVAEMIIPMVDRVNTRQVDWLAWEDPLILSQDEDSLKIERENSLKESQKRLSYVIPMIQIISKAAEQRNLFPPQ